MLETIKQARDGPNFLANRPSVEWIIRRGNIAAFFVLSWIEDPIVVTLYLRHSANAFNGLARRDWVIFWASTLTSNLFWILSLASVLAIARIILGWEASFH